VTANGGEPRNTQKTRKGSKGKEGGRKRGRVTVGLTARRGTTKYAEDTKREKREKRERRRTGRKGKRDTRERRKEKGDGTWVESDGRFD
jgi:hypothetical protein